MPNNVLQTSDRLLLDIAIKALGHVKLEPSNEGPQLIKTPANRTSINLCHLVKCRYANVTLQIRKKQTNINNLNKISSDMTKCIAEFIQKTPTKHSDDH